MVDGREVVDVSLVAAEKEAAHAGFRAGLAEANGKLASHESIAQAEDMGIEMGVARQSSVTARYVNARGTLGLDLDRFDSRVCGEMVFSDEGREPGSHALGLALEYDGRGTLAFGDHEKSGEGCTGLVGSVGGRDGTDSKGPRCIAARCQVDDGRIFEEGRLKRDEALPFEIGQLSEMALGK